MEGQRAAVARSAQEKAAMSKVDRIRADQTQRAAQLEREAGDAEAKVRRGILQYSCKACPGRCSCSQGQGH